MITPPLTSAVARHRQAWMMQRALTEAGIDRGAAAMALFVRGPRKAPLIGKVVGVGMVDEITDRTCVVIDAVDGRVHHAELGRLRPSDVPARGTLAALGGEAVPGKPSAAPKLQLLSPMELERQTAYEGPTWIDQAVLAKWRPILTSRALAPSSEAPSQPVCVGSKSASWSRQPMVRTNRFRSLT